MDNYKIKVKDEAESKEAQELFEQLGYSNGQSKRFGFVYTQNGEIGCDSMEHWDYYNDLCQELTLPKLRDLVVLKRNDVKDANCIDKKREAWYLASDGTYYAWQYRKLCWDTESDACVEAHDIKPINQPQDPALISGDVALANVHKCTVQYLHDDEPYGRWTTITDNLWSQYHLGMFLDPDTKFKFRFKPQTIKVELELPKPFEPEEDCHVYILDDGKTDGYRRYSYEVHGDKGNTFIGIWRTEEEIKQVVEQLRKIRGTNS
ncbi:hypothetical protein LLH92_004018 [Acinetobacter baumannii]|uniref:hypothetical protein n=1 Tax=Acinetobacter nosocomialis TaxID=106654 RepID=UPI0018FFB99A|nr:hypothetical protein [Acinetobacter nosocomialis]EHU1526736.1 hypothetical protein [Acinetobacter baumannii]EHU1538233.1 hypothetical protein [Acinetobacter baumannii]EHU2000510.1 hypothetical protein [Acinetobacter baumannii]EHZ8845559.1 hypothetical protein [Acinetobacter baumannii]EKT8133670.1 hypothetical protein [Acinetobacter baumannii]